MSSTTPCDARPRAPSRRTFSPMHAVRLCCALALWLTACASEPVLTLEHPGPALLVHSPALYPETIEYNPKTDRFLLGSFRAGAIDQVDRDGKVTRLVDDERLCSVLGIAVDVARNRLWAVNADLGASLKPSHEGPKKLAAVGIYDLTTGKPIDYVDLAPLTAGPHLLNGIALDRDGNAYVSDSFSPSIYKVTTRAEATVLLSDPQFRGEGINLNGLVVHPDGYILVIKKSDGALFRVPLAEPARFSRVSLNPKGGAGSSVNLKDGDHLTANLKGGDGLTLVGRKSLLVIANQTPDSANNAAIALVSDDNWRSASVRAAEPLGPVYPTTAVLHDGTLYVVHSRLNELIQSAADLRAALHAEATITAIGRVTP
jgi:hypothetical protein